MSPVHFGSASPPWVLVACNFLAIWLNGRRRIVAYSERESAAVQCKNSFALITVFVLAILAPSVACTVRDRPATSGFVVRVLLMLAAVWSVLGLHASHQIDVGTAQFVTRSATLPVVVAAVASWSSTSGHLKQAPAAVQAGQTPAMLQVRDSGQGPLHIR